MPEFAQGDVVRIKTGPFAAFTGRIEEVDAAQATARIKVNVKVIPYTSSQTIELPLHEIEKLAFTGQREAE